MHVIEKLNDIRKDLLLQLEPLTNNQLNEKLTDETWSIAQVVDHLVKMEETIALGIQQSLQRNERKKVRNKPLSITLFRGVKVPAPKHLIPDANYKTLVELTSALLHSRNQLMDAFESTSEDDRKELYFSHPIFGKVSVAQWFEFVGLHEKRHIKQIKKIKSRLE